MRKKFIAVYALMAVLALGSTTLTSCVDDNESASVTAIRNAKAEQLKALAAAANADAEVQKAEALYKQALTAQTEQQTAEDKARFEAEIESLKAHYEQLRQNYEQQIIQSQASFRNTLYQNYIGANNKLKELEGKYIEAQLNLASAKAGVTTAEKAAQATILAQDEEIAKQQAMIKAYKALPENSRDELLKQIEELTVQIAAKQAEVDLKKQAQADAKKAYAAADDAYNGTTKYDNKENRVDVDPTLKTGQAIKDLKEKYSQVLSEVKVTPEDLTVLGVEIKKYSLDKNQATTQQRRLELDLAEFEKTLGKSTDKWDEDATEMPSLYALLDHFKAAYENAEKQFEDGKITAEALQIVQEQYYDFEKGALAKGIKEVESAKENLNEFKANIALLDENSEDYKAYLAAIDNTIEAAKAYDKADEEYKLEVIACADLKGKKSVAEGLLTGNPDINVKIAECEKAIAEAEAIKVTAGKVEAIIVETAEPRTATQQYINDRITAGHTDENGNALDDKGQIINIGDYLDKNGNVVHSVADAGQVIGYKSEVRNVEAYYKACELEVENLKSEIETQKLIVAQCKAELEAAINSGATDDTPVEETPAE